MNEISLDHIENSVVAECAFLLEAKSWAPKKVHWRVSSIDAAAIEAEIGGRLTRLSMSRAGFAPAADGSQEFWHRSGHHSTATTVEGLDPSDFGDALAVLDVRGRLAAALGLAA